MLPLLATLLPAVTGILDKLIPDKDARDKAKAEAESALLAALAKADADQLAVNKAEAESGSNYRGGWRPAVGWICAAALAYTYIIVPVAMYVSFAIGAPLPKPPVLDNNLWELLTALLGLSGLRTYEKLRNVSK